MSRSPDSDVPGPVSQLNFDLRRGFSKQKISRMIFSSPATVRGLSSLEGSIFFFFRPHGRGPTRGRIMFQDYSKQTRLVYLWILGGGGGGKTWIYAKRGHCSMYAATTSLPRPPPPPPPKPHDDRTSRSLSLATAAANLWTAAPPQPSLTASALR